MPLPLLLLLLAAGGSDAWRYTESDKPEGWPGTCTDGKRQSPVDLITETAERFIVEPLEFFNYRNLNGTVTNNGHSIAIHFDEDNCDSGVTAGMLRSIYILHELHFHWGSEHIVDGIRFPLELHMVHYNSKYGDMKHAMHHDDGLAVIGILFHDSENGTEVLDALLESVKSVSSTVQGKSPAIFNPIDLLPLDKSSFFRYSGSLTTPPCSEIVTWTVMETTLPISNEQMNTFRHVSTDGGLLKHNYRRLQEIGERIIYLLSDNSAKSFTSSLSVVFISFISVAYFR